MPVNIIDGEAVISGHTLHLSNVLDTNSMIPTFDAGDTLILESSPANLNVGNIVIWQRKPNEPLSCHRIIQIKGNYIRTKGDNNWFPDKWFLMSEVKYKVIGVLYKEG
jgi:signal peptidase I